MDSLIVFIIYIMGSEAKLQGYTGVSDFEKALQFYEKVLQVFGQDYQKLQLTFPQKYEDKQDFINQFKELDDLERLMWCEHQLKQAYIQINKRDGAQTARKNILWTLMICKEFKITLNRDYQLMKMIKELWMDPKTTTQIAVKNSLKQIFIELGEEPAQTRSKNKQTKPLSNTPLRQSQTIGCCGGSKCQIF